MKKKIENYIVRDIWRIQLAKIPRRQSFLIRNLRVVLRAFKGFNEDKCALHASALTFYSLLSIVPIFAMAFGVAKGFNLDKVLEKQIYEKFPAQNEVIVNVINFSNSLLENTKGGVVAGVGVALLFWTVIKVLGNIEESFNDIWGVKRMRSLSRRFSDYLSIMLICPLFLILSGGVTVFVNTQAVLITQKIAILGPLGSVISFLTGFLPYVFMWGIFAFLYAFIPNTKVNIVSAILGGVIAGSIYQFLQWVYVNFQVGVANYNAIYGSFAALPLFLVWLQTSWRIVFFGAEISFAHQNIETYEFEPDCLSVSPAFRKLLALRIVTFIVKLFAQGETPQTAAQIAHALEMPIRLVRDIIFHLTEVKVLSVVSHGEDRAPAYQPACDISVVTVKFVLDQLESQGTQNIPVAKSQDLANLQESLSKFSTLIEKSPANVLLKDI